MIKRMARKRLKQIEEDIDELREIYRIIEVRPCKNDEDLLNKDKELHSLLRKIYALERDKEEYRCTRSGIEAQVEHDFDSPDAI
jgi:hypothetical protein